jgi:hypothetical protein
VSITRTPIVAFTAAAILVGVATFLSSGLTAQQTAASRTLLAMVFDRNGRPTVDVDADDFVVEEGNDERDILAVQVADYPVALLIDNGADAIDALPAIRAAAAQFIRRIGQRPVAVATYAEPDALVASFDDDRERVLAAVADLTTASSLRRRPLAALTKIAERIEALAPRFAVVVMVSAMPIDAGSQPPDDRIAPIVDSGAVVHVIGLRPPAPDRESAGDLARVIADQTRGQFTGIYSPLSLTVALDRLSDQLSSEVMIDYLVPAGTSGANARVGIRVPGARVRGLGVSR